MPVALRAVEARPSPLAADPQPRLRLRLLGPMQATDSTGASVLPRARKGRALLAFLALAAPRPVPRARLTALLWSTRENEQARASLRQALHELQESLGALGAMIAADRTTVALRPAGLWVDSLEVAHGLSAAHDSLDLFRGEMLEDLGGLDPAWDRWLQVERGLARERWEAHVLAVLSAPQHPSDAEATALRIVASDPAQAPAWRAIIQARLAAGDQPGAAAAFDRCRAAMARTGRSALPADLAAGLDRLRDDAPLPETGGAVPETVATATGSRGTPPAEGAVRLGVRPMRALPGQQDDALSFGLAEEIATALSRFRWMSCVASSSLAALAGETLDSDRWRRLDLDFLLDGTIQRSGDRVRITARLLDLRDNGAVIWARRFDRESTDIFALQEEIAAETVAQIDPELLLRAGERAASRLPPGDPTAHELLLKAIPAIYRLEKSAFQTAGAMLRSAIALDSGNAAAHAWLAYWTLLQIGQGWADDPPGASAQAAALADRAVTLDPNDARGVTLSGHVRAFIARRPEEGIALHQRALSLNPNLPIAWVFLGLANSYLGHHDEAIANVSQAQRLSPFDPHGFFFDTALTMPYLLKRDHQAVLRIGRRAIELNPGFSSSYKGMLAALGHLGLPAEASSLLARLRRLEPNLSLAEAVDRSPLTRPEDRAHYEDGLRRAGLR